MGFRIALVLGLLATSAAAQDGSEGAPARTPEAAQAFLATYLQRGGWEGEASNWFDGETYRYFDGANWQEASEPNRDWRNVPLTYGDVRGVEIRDPCTTDLGIAAKWKHRVFLEDPLMPITAKDVTGRIDWRAVDPIKVHQKSMLSRERGGASVNITRYEVIVWSPKTRSGVIFSTGEKAIADRAAFAMTYLQEHCDPTSNTAF